MEVVMDKSRREIVTKPIQGSVDCEDVKLCNPELNTDLPGGATVPIRLFAFILKALGSLIAAISRCV